MGQLGREKTIIVGKKLGIEQGLILTRLKDILHPTNYDNILSPSDQIYSFFSFLNSDLIPNKLFSVPKEFEYPFSGLEGRIRELNFDVQWDNGNYWSSTYHVSRHGMGKREFSINIIHRNEYFNTIEVDMTKLVLDRGLERKWSFGCRWGDEGICISDDLVNMPLSL